MDKSRGFRPFDRGKTNSSLLPSAFCPLPFLVSDSTLAYRPESEGKWALPQHEFGLDVIALCGAWRYQEHRSVPQIHQQLQQRGLCVSQRSFRRQKAEGRRMTPWINPGD